ncbi:hypothetical protein [Kitasatospora sp. MMS16-BH015]|uniref:hypothetical protein n=1 Tax=Kitasatospora sp. MMS16-BH015 TaxID=2018025 RepID=UPI00131A5F48|nr:hypothetical protein [Kitasatospora sp. MMS16-BH015]
MLVVITACGSRAATVAVAPATSTATATASADQPPSSTPSISPQVQNAASALSAQGRGAFADIWGALALDGANNRVLLYATDVQRAQQMIQSAHTDRPDTAGIEVKVIKCTYTSKDERAAVDRVVAAQLTKTLKSETYGAAPTADGTGIQVFTSAEGLKSPDLAKQVQSIAGSVPATLVLGSKGVPA